MPNPMNDLYPELYSSYRWLVPSQFNIADVCAHRWAGNTHEGRSIAVYYEDEVGQRELWTYTRLSETAQRLANGLERMQVNPGDRVVIAMTQRPEAIAALIATLSIGAVAVPLASQSSPAALRHCLADCGARVAIADAFCGPRILQLLPAPLKQVIGFGFNHDSILSWRTLLARQPATFKTLPTPSSSPALLLYPAEPDPDQAGVVLSHAALIGALPGFVASQNWFPQPGDTFWSPDWHAWGSLLGGLLPALYFGRPVVAAPNGFSPHQAMALLTRYKTSNACLSTTLAIRIAQEPDLLEQHADDLALRAMAVHGLPLPEDITARYQQALGLTPNQVWSQPEAAAVIGDSHLKWPGKPGSLGRVYPGHRVAALDSLGRQRPVGMAGELAIHRQDIHDDPDPALFQQHWNAPDAAQEHFLGDWFLTGLWGRIDAEGYVWPMPRKGSDDPRRLKSPHVRHS